MRKSRKHTAIRGAALALALLLALPAPAALAAPSALESVSSLAPGEEGSPLPAESAQPQPTEEPAPTASPSSQPEEQPPEESTTEESAPEGSSPQEDAEEAPEEGAGALEETQQETFGSYPLLVVGGHKAYMSGEEGARFYPNRAMTRAEMAQVLYNLLAAVPSVTENHFSDVSSTAWYAKAVNALVELGVLSGYEDNTYRPNKAVTRAEFVTAVTKCFDNLPDGGAGSLTDVAGHWAQGFIRKAVTAGWISGFGDNTFRPDSSIKRCEVTAIMNNALERTGEGFASDAGTQEFVDVFPSDWFYQHVAEAADPVGSAIEVGCTVRVTATGGLNLRSGPSTGSSVVTTLATGSLLTVTSLESGGWLGVKTASGAAGYVSGQYVEYHSSGTVDPEPEPEPDPDPEPGDFEVGQTVRVTATGGLNLRSSPSTTASVVTVLATGVTLTITSLESDGWLGVKTASGTAGYVSGKYVEVYTGEGNGGTATGASLSASNASLAQYQSLRLDGSVTSNLGAMRWESSNPSVAYVGYTVPYGGDSVGAIVYGAAPGTATITFTDGKEATASCTVTVTAAEPVRFAYSDQNIVTAGQEFNLTAVTDTSRAAVKFEITDGPAGGSWETTSYSTESRASGYGLPTNSTRVFTRRVSFGRAGTYTVRASSKTASGSYTGDYTFTVLVLASPVDATTATDESRRVSTTGLNIIANFEGGVPEVEDDVLVPGNPTVGYGYVVPVNSAFYNNLTPAELFAHLAEYVNERFSPAVESFRAKYNIKMTQAQFDALTSFVVNCGTGTLSSDYGFRRAMLNAVDLSGFSGTATGTITVTDVDLDAAPVFSDRSITSQQVTQLDLAAKVTVNAYTAYRTESQQEVWYQVSTSDGKVGWIPAGYVELSGSWSRDLSWADSTVLANNFLQWNKAGGVIAGLVYRRLAECKIFFFGNYEEALHSSSNYSYNTYNFDFPAEAQAYNHR